MAGMWDEATALHTTVVFEDDRCHMKQSRTEDSFVHRIESNLRALQDEALTAKDGKLPFNESEITWGVDGPPKRNAQTSYLVVEPGVDGDAFCGAFGACEDFNADGNETRSVLQAAEEWCEGALKKAGSPKTLLFSAVMLIIGLTCMGASLQWSSGDLSTEATDRLVATHAQPCPEIQSAVTFPAIEAQCAGAIQQWCTSTTPGATVDIYSCLEDYVDDPDMPASCRGAIESGVTLTVEKDLSEPSITFMCASDTAKFCTASELSGAPLKLCLSRHLDELNTKCKATLIGTGTSLKTGCNQMR